MCTAIFQCAKNLDAILSYGTPVLVAYIICFTFAFYFSSFSLFCHFFSCTVLCFLLLLFCLCRRICPSVFFLSCLLSCYRKNIFSMYFCCSRCSIQKTKLGHVGGDVEEKIKLHIYSHLDSSGCKSL